MLQCCRATEIAFDRLGFIPGYLILIVAGGGLVAYNGAHALPRACCQCTLKSRCCPVCRIWGLTSNVTQLPNSTSAFAAEEALAFIVLLSMPSKAMPWRVCRTCVLAASDVLAWHCARACVRDRQLRHCVGR